MFLFFVKTILLLNMNKEESNFNKWGEILEFGNTIQKIGAIFLHFALQHQRHCDIRNDIYFNGNVSSLLTHAKCFLVIFSSLWIITKKMKHGSWQWVGAWSCKGWAKIRKTTRKTSLRAVGGGRLCRKLKINVIVKNKSTTIFHGLNSYSP